MLVTGGAGFIGSNLVLKLLEQGHEVVIYDNLSTGRTEFIPNHPNLQFIEGYLAEYPKLLSALDGCTSVFHLAGHADVRHGKENNGWRDLRNNAEGTQSVLIAMAQKGVKHIALASSAVVYGEPSIFPTPESYRGPQTSYYGASKLYAESIVQAASNYHGITGAIFRFVSLVGEYYQHGVIYDFVGQLLKHPKTLTVLGDGSQQKSYLYVGDCINAMLCAPRTASTVETYNLGHDYLLTVREVTGIILSEMNLSGVQITYGTGNRGWPGDSPVVHLDTLKIKRSGWRPSLSIEEGIRRTVRWLLANRKMMF